MVVLAGEEAAATGGGAAGRVGRIGGGFGLWAFFEI